MSLPGASGKRLWTDKLVKMASSPKASMQSRRLKHCIQQAFAKLLLLVCGWSSLHFIKSWVQRIRSRWASRKDEIKQEREEESCREEGRHLSQKSGQSSKAWPEYIVPPSALRLLDSSEQPQIPMLSLVVMRILMQGAEVQHHSGLKGEQGSFIWGEALARKHSILTVAIYWWGAGRCHFCST